LTLARDVFRLPPLAGSGPVSESASASPTALARSATAWPLNVAVACAKLATGPNAKAPIRQIATSEGFVLFITCSFVFGFRSFNVFEARALG
jgi:hypothetical protein